MQNRDIALEELNRLKEIIDSKSFSSSLNQLQNRIWLMHWSLFIFFNHGNGRNGIIDLFFQDRQIYQFLDFSHSVMLGQDAAFHIYNRSSCTVAYSFQQFLRINCYKIIIS